MPVFLDTVQAPTAQQRSDLLKALADWPETLPLLHPADADREAWLDALLDDPNQHLFAGRFNDRWLAAAWLEQTETTRCELRALCVRAITRRRGVGERVLKLLCQWLDERQLSLHCALPVTLPTRAWFGQYGFRADGNGHLVRLPQG